MDKTHQLKRGLAIFLFALMLGGSAMTLWAQQEQQEPIEPAPSEQPERQDAENTPDTVSEETDVDDSPFDYQSSEKISEDLSVSFPVDI